MELYGATRTNDHATAERLIDSFFMPYLAIHNRKAGYAVSIVKAVATLVDRGAGPVRPPLTDLTGEECEQLDALIKSLGPQQASAPRCRRLSTDCRAQVSGWINTSRIAVWFMALLKLI